MAIQTAEENKREEELYGQEAAELDGVVSELQSQKDKLPEDQERFRESLREKRELAEDRDHRKFTKPLCVFRTRPNAEDIESLTSACLVFLSVQKLGR